MGGRKAHYTTRIAKRLCEHIALGDTLKRALEKEPLGPNIPQFWRWLDEYPDFKEMYERARMLQADLKADAITELAERVLNNPKFANAYKVAADIMRWQAEIQNPKKYGTKIQVEHKEEMSPQKLRAEIRQIELELGLMPKEEQIIDVEVKEVKRVTHETN